MRELKVKNWLLAILVLFLVGDLGYSFVQHYYHSLDGDIAAIVVPAEWYQQVIDDPFGISVLKEGKEYASTNRHFANNSLRIYFRTVPNWLQTFIPPIKSVYFAAALIKIVIQFLLILVLSAYVSPSKKLWSKEGIVAAALITPLFQTEGFNSFMGIIDHSITYLFFYALPILGILIFFLPYFKKFYQNKFFKTWWLFPLLPLAVYLSFHGPLNPPVIIMIVGLMILGLTVNTFFQKGNKNVITTLKSLPYRHFILPICFALLCLYSFYIGTFNLEGKDMVKPLGERYLILLKALPYYFTNKIGLPLLIITIIINCIILFKNRENTAAKKLLIFFGWLVIFSVIYVLLLPLGGYRSYRPMIIRYDTFMPVTILLIYAFAASSLFLFKSMEGKGKFIHLAFIILVLTIFTVADKPYLSRKDCEHSAFASIATATEPVLKFENNCNIMSWLPLTYPDASITNVKLLKHWNIVDKDKEIRYYH